MALGESFLHLSPEIYVDMSQAITPEQQASGTKLPEIATGATEDDWQEYSNCLGVDPDLFFPERGASSKEAKAVCRGCSVAEFCLEYALANGEKFGIWGGESERSRRRIRRARALANRGIIEEA